MIQVIADVYALRFHPYNRLKRFLSMVEGGKKLADRCFCLSDRLKKNGYVTVKCGNSGRHREEWIFCHRGIKGFYI